MTRIAIVDYNKCKSTKCQFECGLICPSNKQSKQCIVLEDIENIGKKAKIGVEFCTGCGLCVKKCPYGAIVITNLPKELSQDKLLYSYGENSFRIYKYPSIKKGHSIGILGANGLGKSTILKILSNEIKVNNKMFVGDEMYKYMNLLANNKLTIAYKPQDIEKYRFIEKSVMDFIKENNFENSQYIQKLQLEHLFDRKISQLSGGELQRLLIAMTCSQDANSYIFDEPCAFLDIKQRIKVSNYISEKITPDNYLLCVEHDLCILDSMTDNTLCLYGETNCYGVITSIQSTRNAINSYLDGYFKAENMKFRDEPVSFHKYLIENNNSNNQILFEYADFEIKYEKFNLNAKGSKINSAEITLLIGENGTGKTSYITKISKDQNLVTSIKFQNPYIKYKKTVYEYLEENINSKLADALFVTNIIKKLNIDKLYDVEVSSLSGGQMQKLSIITCLGKDANLYLLDEPSAFIDIEDRCVLSKILKQFVYDNKKSMFIIEHDITLATNIANKVIVFDGEPGKYCYGSQQYNLSEGINMFLKNMNITMRKDKISGRPGINKLDSQKDIEQKKEGKYYIVE